VSTPECADPGSSDEEGAMSGEASYEVKQIIPADGDWCSVWAVSDPDVDGRHYAVERVLAGAIVQEVVPHDGDSADECRRTEGHYVDVSGTRAVVGLDAHCDIGRGRLEWDDGFAEWLVGYVHRGELDDAHERLEQDAVKQLASIEAGRQRRAARRALKAAVR